MDRAFEYNVTTLRISRALVSLLSRSETEKNVVSLAWIGDFEIYMCPALPTAATKLPLFVLQFFDHDAQSLIASRVCYSLAEGAIAFDEFLSMAEPVTSGPH